MCEELTWKKGGQKGTLDRCWSVEMSTITVGMTFYVDAVVVVGGEFLNGIKWKNFEKNSQKKIFFIVL